MEKPSLNAKRYVVRYSGSIAPKYSISQIQGVLAPSDGKHLLVVDDDPYFRSLFKVMLGQTGCQIGAIWEADKSEAAIDICSSKPVDLIFCDFNLPTFSSQNGLETIQELRRICPEIPVYMVTADHSESLIRSVHALGANGHLLKPINLGTLRKILKLHLSHTNLPA